ncbi:MAG: hypothetical protein ABW098_05055 [Candidatus Thiodiazotropha sp.]
MKQIITLIAISTTLTLTACSNSENAESSRTTGTAETVVEQQNPTLSGQQEMPSDQAAFEAGGAMNENREEVESTISNMSGEQTETTDR